MLNIRRSNSSRLLENNKTMPAIIPNWSQIKSPNALIRRRSHHSAVVYKNILYVYGGYEPNIGIVGDMMKFGKDQTWKKQWSPEADQSQSYEQLQQQSPFLNIIRSDHMGIQKPFSTDQRNFSNQGMRISIKRTIGQVSERCGQISKSKFIKAGSTRVKQEYGLKPEPRHCHSAVLYKDKMYVFGGLTKPLENNNQLWSYEFATKRWRLHQEQNSDQNRPCKLDSHRAQIHQNKMIVYGGFSQGRFLGNIWSLNLDSMKWEILFDYQKFERQQLGDGQRQNFNQKITQISQQKVPKPRSNGTINVLNNNLYIFGGTNMSKKFDDLWRFNLDSRQFNKIDASNKPTARSHHSSVIYKNYLIIFGGIKAKNHELNDMIYLELENQKSIMKWKIIWADTQQQIVGYTMQRQSKRRQSRKISNLNNSSKGMLNMKNSRRNFGNPFNAGSFTTSSQKSNNSKQNMDKRINQHNKNSVLSSFLPSLVGCTVTGALSQKYRCQLKDVNYYNDSIPKILDRDGIKKQNVGKSLISNLLRMASIGEPCKNYSSSLQNLTNSIMLTLTQNLNKSNFGENIYSQWPNAILKYENPRARDGHSCSLLQSKFLLIFGGDQHMMSYNSLIVVDLQNLIQTTIDNQDDEQQNSEKQINKSSYKQENQNGISNSINSANHSNDLSKIKNKKSMNNTMNSFGSAFSGFKGFMNSISR